MSNILRFPSAAIDVFQIIRNMGTGGVRGVVAQALLLFNCIQSVYVAFELDLGWMTASTSGTSLR